jgi:hypothetical protein
MVRFESWCSLAMACKGREEDRFGREMEVRDGGTDRL